MLMRNVHTRFFMILIYHTHIKHYTKYDILPLLPKNVIKFLFGKIGGLGTHARTYHQVRQHHFSLGNLRHSLLHWVTCYKTIDHNLKGSPNKYLLHLAHFGCGPHFLFQLQVNPPKSQSHVSKFPIFWMV